LDREHEKREKEKEREREKRKERKEKRERERKKEERKKERKKDYNKDDNDKMLQLATCRLDAPEPKRSRLTIPTVNGGPRNRQQNILSTPLTEDKPPN
jgi:hypothetical protein